MSEFKLTGKIKEILEVQTGTSQAGKEWKKVEFTIVNNDGYNDTEVLHAFEIFGVEKVDSFIKYNSVGKEVDVNFNPSSRRWVSPKGEIRHFTVHSAWKIFGTSNEVKPQQGEVVEDTSDGLPF